MHNIGKKMDYSVKKANSPRISHHKDFHFDLTKMPRIFPASLPVNSIGYQYIDYQSTGVYHKTIDFGLVLSAAPGEYTYSVDAKKYTYKPPFFFLKGPGKAYGNHTFGPREVFFLSYNNKTALMFKSLNLEPGSPGLEIPESSPLIKWTLEAIGKSDSMHELGTVDEIDRLCEMILLEASVLKRQRNGDASENTSKIAEIITYINKNFRKKFKLSELIKKHGFSKRSFYREWNKKHSISPVDYIESLKMSQASNLLSSTNMPISEIALDLNYEDPMYFSRRFSKQFNISPREYRKQFKI
jgi:AraC-like DNA-binding protein